MWWSCTSTQLCSTRSPLWFTWLKSHEPDFLFQIGPLLPGVVSGVAWLSLPPLASSASLAPQAEKCQVSWVGENQGLHCWDEWWTCCTCFLMRVVFLPTVVSFSSSTKRSSQAVASFSKASWRLIRLSTSSTFEPSSAARTRGSWPANQDSATQASRPNCNTSSTAMWE